MRTLHADGLVVDVHEPDGAPIGRAVLLHGADSRRGNHADAARALCAAGLRVGVADQRGHGETGGRLDGRAVADVGTVAALLGEDLPLGLRGTSMGGCLALMAARELRPAAVVATCPAFPDRLRDGLRTGRFDFAVDRPALEALLDDADLEAAAAELAERLLLVHAEADELVPVGGSRALHEASGGRASIVVLPGGDHPSTGHDPATTALGARFLAGWCRQGGR